MGASISSDVMVGMATMILAVAILLWGFYRMMWCSEPHGNPLPGRHRTQGRCATAAVPVRVDVEPRSVRRRTRLR